VLDKIGTLSPDSVFTDSDSAVFRFYYPNYSSLGPKMNYGNQQFASFPLEESKKRKPFFTHLHPSFEEVAR